MVQCLKCTGVSTGEVSRLDQYISKTAGRDSVSRVLPTCCYYLVALVTTVCVTLVTTVCVTLVATVCVTLVAIVCVTLTICVFGSRT